MSQSDANAITVSFDQMSAVRLRDKAKLKAVETENFWGEESCNACRAQSCPGTSGCFIDIARATRFCHPLYRKDGKPIQWRLANE